MRRQNSKDNLRLVVVDYGMGNLQSVVNALRFIGSDASISSEPKEIEAANALILPGVGAFGTAMSNLARRGLVGAIRRKVMDNGAPFMGICLGLQLAAETSEERGRHEGLALFSGHVRRIPVPSGIRLPHVGWNSVSISRPSVLLDNVDSGSSFYFVHSYALEGTSARVVATCEYGVTVNAAVEQGHILATQFHPERSQTNGLRLLKNFVRYVAARVEAMPC